MAEKCPKCRKFSLEESGGGKKRCYRDGCGYRQYSDGSYSILRCDIDKIRRVQKFSNGEEKIIREFSYS